MSEQQRIAKLDQVLQTVPYQYENRAALRNHVVNLLQSTPTLVPAAQEFRSPGKTATLFYLGGVLPINYKGATYNIPVTIYFDPPYPRGPPRCFVTPSGSMALKQPHPNVDAGGMITVPYLNSWNQRSLLTELIPAVGAVFSQNPPVYSTQPAAAPAQPPPAAAGALRGLPVAAATPVPVRPTATIQPGHSGAKERLIAEATRGLRERWTLALDPVVDDLNAQADRKAALQAAAAKVGGQMEDLRRAAADAGRDAEDLKAKEEELRKFLERQGPSGPDAAGLREAQDPDTQQVLSCLAEEHALEEFLVALDDLLAAKLIGLDAFLREVRDVSRKQFMCKTQRQKAAAAVVAAAV